MADDFGALASEAAGELEIGGDGKKKIMSLTPIQMRRSLSW